MQKHLIKNMIKRLVVFPYFFSADDIVKLLRLEKNIEKNQNIKHTVNT